MKKTHEHHAKTLATQRCSTSDLWNRIDRDEEAKYFSQSGQRNYKMWCMILATGPSMSTDDLD